MAEPCEVCKARDEFADFFASDTPYPDPLTFNTSTELWLATADTWLWEHDDTTWDDWSPVAVALRKRYFELLRAEREARRPA